MVAQKLFYGFGGFILGIIVLSFVTYNSAADIIIVENESKYGFDETIEKIKTESAEKGWKIPAIHRIDKSVNKVGHFSLPVAVIELCNPNHAAKVLQDDRDKVVTSILPCRVSIYKTKNGKIIVSRMNTTLIGEVFSETVSKTMDAATTDTEIILESVIK